MNAFELQGVTRRFGANEALVDVTITGGRGSIIGLIGRNGSGKSTLLRTIAGLYLPDQGRCVTLGTETRALGARELSRIGFADQHAALLRWMTGEQMLRYVSSFYRGWDRALERRLVRELELDVSQRVYAMSPGNAQKLSLVLATSHRPELLLLDEPLSDLDPLARQGILQVLLERFDSDGMTMVISSHLLHDIEPVVNRIVCLERGRVAADDELDALYDRFEEWIVTSAAGRLPRTFAEPYVLDARGEEHRARLLVRDGARHRGTFAATYDVTVDARPVNLETIFPLLVRGRDVAVAEQERVA